MIILLPVLLPIVGGALLALLPLEDLHKFPAGQQLDQYVSMQVGQLQLPVAAQGDGAACAGEEELLPSGPVHHLLQLGLPGVQGGLSGCAGGGVKGLLGLGEQGEKVQTKLFCLRHILCIQIYHLAGGAQKAPC